MNGNVRWTITGMALALLVGATSVNAGPVVWNKGDTSGDKTYNLTDPANWTGGYPANGSNVFVVLSAATAANWTQAITNAPSDKFTADSLSVSNVSTKGHLVLTFSGEAFLTNGVGKLDIGGVTLDRNLTVTFSSNLQAKAVQFTGSAGSGTATLSLNGPSTIGSLTFNAFAGNNILWIRGSLSADTLIVTNLGATSAGTLAGNATVGRLVLDNLSSARFTITNSTTTVNGAAQSVAGGFTLASDATLSVTGTGGLVFSNVAPVINGTVRISNSSLESKTAWNNNGAVLLENGFLTGSGVVTNLVGRQIRGWGAISNTVVNAGELVASDGELQLVYSVRGLGSYRAAVGGTLTFVTGGSISALFNTGGTVRVEGLLTNTTAFVNQGTLSMAGGVYSSVTALNNPAGFTIAGFGTISAPFNNSGTVAIGAPALAFTRAVTNAGWIIFGTATGVFAEPVFNSGTLALGTGTAHFNKTLTVASNGILTALPGAELYLRGDFLNYSTNNVGFDLLDATVKFDGGGGSNTQLFRVAGLDFGPTESGFTNNFAIGDLWIGSSPAIVKLIGDSPAMNALYVESLTITPGSVLILNGFTVYAWMATLDGLLYTDAGGRLVIIPEPASLALVTGGVLLAVALIRRRRR